MNPRADLELQKALAVDLADPVEIRKRIEAEEAALEARSPSYGRRLIRQVTIGERQDAGKRVSRQAAKAKAIAKRRAKRKATKR